MPLFLICFNIRKVEHGLYKVSLKKIKLCQQQNHLNITWKSKITRNVDSATKTWINDNKKKSKGKFGFKYLIDKTKHQQNLHNTFIFTIQCMW